MKNLQIFLLFLLVSIRYNGFAIDLLAATQLQAESSSEKYKKLANEYQEKASYYNALANLSESDIKLNVPSSIQLLSKTSKSKIIEAEPYNPWNGTTVGIGGGNNTGLTSSTNLQGNININYKPGESDAGWNFSLITQYNYLNTSTKGDEINRFYAQQNDYYMFNKYNGIFGQVSYLADPNSGYYYIWNENVGYQLQLYRSDLMNLLFSFGPGLQQQGVVGQPSSTNVPTWLIQATYNLNVNDITILQEQLQNIASSLTVTTNSITSLNLKFYKKLAISLSYQFTYYSVPRPYTAQTITITSIGLIYPL